MRSLEIVGRQLALTLAVLFALVGPGSHAPAVANWLTKLAKEAGEAGGSVARHAGHGLDELAGMARHLKSLPHDAKGVSLAAHATPEGHWKFTNRDGEVFTAASPEEMARVVANLAPDHVGDGKLKLFLSEDTVFARPEMIKQLPGDGELHLLAGGRSYRLRVDPSGPGGSRFLAQVKPNLELRLGDRRLFDEALWHLRRPLSKSGIRVVSLEPGAAHTLTTVPRFDQVSKAALIDRIDPWKLPAAMSSLQGQTVVVVGRLEGEFLHFRPVGGGEKSVLIGDLRRAAKDGDVNLIVLQAADPIQPGGRNWFWQRIEVKGLDAALKRADFADFLDALGQHRQNMVVDARVGLSGRIGFDAKPAGSGLSTSTDSITDAMTSWTENIFSQAVGNVIPSGIDADIVDKERQQELDRRIVPGISSIIQFLYIGGLVLGLAGLSYVRHWWTWLWPMEERADYAGALGYHAARAVRLVLFVLVFLPLTGIPAGLWSGLVNLAGQVWFVLTLPWRMVRWLWQQIVPLRV